MAEQWPYTDIMYGNLTVNITGNLTVIRDAYTIDILEQRDREIFIYPLSLIIMFISVGLTGNSIVFYIFTFRWKRTKTAVFILSLALLDLVSCCVNMPVEFVIMYHTWTFDYDLICKISRYLTYIVSASYSFVLVAIACDRYLMVCRPFRRLTMTSSYAAKTCFFAFLLAVVTQTPSLLIYGTYTFQRRDPNNANIVYEGYKCYLKNHADKLIVKGFYSFLFLGHIVIFMLLFTLYILIGRSLFISHQMAFDITPRKSKLNRQSLFSAMTGVIPRSALCSRGSKTASIDHINAPYTPPNHRTSRRSSDSYGYARVLALGGRSDNGRPDNVKLFNECLQLKELDAVHKKANARRSLELDTEKASRRSKRFSYDPGKENNGVGIGIDRGLPPPSPLTTAVCGSESAQPLVRRRTQSFDASCRLSSTSVSTSIGPPSYIKELCLRQNTLIMRMVSFTFVLSYLPFLVIVTLRYTHPDIPDKLPFLNRICYECFIRSYFLNSIIRPFIYIFMDKDYRKCVKNVIMCRK